MNEGGDVQLPLHAADGALGLRHAPAALHAAARSIRASSSSTSTRRASTPKGRWPWSRNKIAAMVRQLFERYKVRVVGFDVAFPEPDTSSGLHEPRATWRKTELQGQRRSSSACLERARALARLRPDLRRRDRASTRWCWASSSAARSTRPASLPPPSVRRGTLRRSWDVIHNLATGYSGNIPALQQNARPRPATSIPQLDFDGIDAPRADVHALRRRLLRGAVARDRCAPTSATRPSSSRSRRRSVRQRRARSRG